MWLGWKKINIDSNGMPTDKETQWVASCFVLFTHIIYIGEVVNVSESSE